MGSGSFIFRGPEGRVELRANHLNTFHPLAEAVDERTWL
jgi:hypothetical protein